jgi:hypothetical protein
MLLDLSGLFDQPVHASGFGGQHLGVLELDTMSPADAMFSYCRLVWISQMNVPVVLLHPGINGTVTVPNVYLTTFAGYAVTRGVFSHRSYFAGRRKLAIFLGGRPTDLMLCLDSIRLMRLKVVLTKGRRATEAGFSEVVATLFGGSRARRICRSP